MKRTFAEVAAEWMKVKRQQVKESTFATYEFCMRKHLVPVFGGKTEITEMDVQSYVTAQIEAGRSTATMRERVNTLRMAVSHGARDGWRSEADWHICYVRAQTLRPVAVMPAEHQAALLRHVREKRTPRNLGIYLGLTMGLRIGEVCGLKWGDLSEWTRSVSIRRTVERINCTKEGDVGRTKVVCSSPKTPHSNREIPASDELLEMARCVRGGAGDDCYMLSNTTAPIEPRTYREYYKRVLAQLDIPAIRFHALRHSFATRCIENNVDCKTVSEILGHANVGITLDLYTHPNMAKKLECIACMVESLDKREGDK